MVLKRFDKKCAVYNAIIIDRYISLVLLKVTIQITLIHCIIYSGGFEVCSAERKWSKVARRMGFPQGKGIGSILKNHYEKILYRYDVFKSNGADNKETVSFCLFWLSEDLFFYVLLVFLCFSKCSKLGFLYGKRALASSGAGIIILASVVLIYNENMFRKLVLFVTLIMSSIHISNDSHTYFSSN